MRWRGRAHLHSVLTNVVRGIAPTILTAVILGCAWLFFGVSTVQAMTVDTSNRSAVVAFYYSTYLASNGVSSGYTGNVATCDPGTVSPEYQSAGLTRVSYFRAMAGLSGNLNLSASWNSECQAAALMMSANGQLSHSPPSSWLCYTTAGADAASKSNLAYGPSSLADAIDVFVGDSGVSSLGHRRWVLYPVQQTLGVGASFGGSFSAYALWVIGGWGARPPSPEWIAWPGPGFFPYFFVPGVWSFSYPGADFSGTSVAMTLDGNPLSLTLVPTPNGYGDNTLGWTPQGVSSGRPSSDRRVHVALSGVIVAGVQRSFAYDVTIIDPAAPVAVGDHVGRDTGVRLLPNTPNPFVGATTIRYVLGTEASVRLSIHDVAGRLVVRLEDSRRGSGAHAAPWNGRAMDGRMAAPGVYECRLQTDSGSVSRTLLLLR